MWSMKQDKESWELEIPEKLENAAKRKEDGNALFKAGNYARAAKRYEKVSAIDDCYGSGKYITVCNVRIC